MPSLACLPQARRCLPAEFSEPHNADGRYVAYLHPGHQSAGYFRGLDPDLYDRLASVAARERSTAALAGAGLLDAGTRFFGDLLDSLTCR